MNLKKAGCGVLSISARSCRAMASSGIQYGAERRAHNKSSGESCQQGAKVNSLVDQLRSANSLTIEGLKKLYRSLALKLHPDVTRESGKQFVKLQE